MKKIFLLSVFSLVLCTTEAALAQSANSNKLRIAVLDPATTGVDGSTMAMVREMISSTLVNTGKFNIVERSLLDKIMKEQKFSNSGAVDESQATELGKLLGVKKVIVPVLSSAAGRHMLSIKVIDVQSASIEKQETKITTGEILDVVELVTLAAIGETSIAAAEAKQAESRAGLIVELAFAGFTTSNNPTAQVFCDGQLMGSGTLNQGFSIKFTDEHPGARTVTISWSGTVPQKSFTINTATKRYYQFEYKNTGFGYALVLKK